VAFRFGRNTSARPIDKTGDRNAALAYEREQKLRDRERAREEAAREKERERQQQAVDKAQSALDEAEQEGRSHPGRDEGSRKAVAGGGRPLEEKERLSAALQRARKKA
jgi:hypothetical protein